MSGFNMKCNTAQSRVYPNEWGTGESPKVVENLLISPSTSKPPPPTPPPSVDSPPPNFPPPLKVYYLHFIKIFMLSPNTNLFVVVYIAVVSFFFNFMLYLHNVILIFISIDIQYLENVVFSIEKGSNDQNY